MSLKTTMGKVFNKTLGACIGAGIGLVTGPLAATGKLYALIEMDLLKEEYGIDQLYNGSRYTLYLDAIILTPFALATGVLYGPIRGAQVGAQLGIKKSFLGVPKELFTYDPGIGDFTANKIPEKRCWFNSYRIFHRNGVFLTEAQRAERSEKKKLAQVQINASTLARLHTRPADNNCPFFKLPPEILVKIAAHTGSADVDIRKRERVANSAFTLRK